MENYTPILRTRPSTSVETICRINFRKLLLTLYVNVISDFEKVLSVVPITPTLHRTKNIKETELPGDLTNGHLDDYATVMGCAAYNLINDNYYFRFRDYELSVLHPHHAIIINNEVIRLVKELRLSYGDNIKLKDGYDEFNYILVKEVSDVKDKDSVRLDRNDTRTC